MNCPKCKSEQIGVRDTRIYEKCVKRRRLCFDCGFRFSTVEISVNEYETLQEKVNLYQMQFQKIKECADTVTNERKDNG